MNKKQLINKIKKVIEDGVTKIHEGNIKACHIKITNKESQVDIY